MNPGKSETHSNNGLWLRFGKRTFDLLVAGIALILLSPVIALIALVVRVNLGAPVFFRQQRPGWRGCPFILLKFRTMRNATDAHGAPLPDDQRMTALGAFLRNSSLDELPELINVVRGEMSLVGPRPLLMEYLPLYSRKQMRRHDVRPGLTGLAQVNGRNAISWEQKFDFDVFYVDHATFALDLRILLLTVVRVLSRADISQQGHVTAERFRGQH